MSDIKNQKSIGGLKANGVAFLVTLSYFMGLGLIFSLITLVLEENNEFVRKYAKQTFAISVLSLLGLFLNVLIVVGTIVYMFILIAFGIIQLISLFTSFSGKDFDVPFLDKILNLFFAE